MEFISGYSYSLLLLNSSIDKCLQLIMLSTELTPPLSQPLKALYKYHLIILYNTQVSLIGGKVHYLLLTNRGNRQRKK